MIIKIFEANDCGIADASFVEKFFEFKAIALKSRSGCFMSSHVKNYSFRHERSLMFAVLKRFIDSTFVVTV